MAIEKKLKTVFILSLISFCVFVSCRNTDSNDPDRIRQSQWDVMVIPDKFNTGPKPGTSFRKLTASGNIAENVYVNFRTDTNPYTYVLTSYGPNKDKLPDRSIVENYDFSD